jgi:hypothetical protein
MCAARAARQRHPKRAHKVLLDEIFIFGNSSGHLRTSTHDNLIMDTRRKHVLTSLEKDNYHYCYGGTQINYE